MAAKKRKGIGGKRAGAGRRKGRAWGAPTLAKGPQRLVEGRGRSAQLLADSGPEEKRCRESWENFPIDYDHVTDFGIRLIDTTTGKPKAGSVIEYREAVYWRTLGLLGGVGAVGSRQMEQAKTYAKTLAHLQIMVEQETAGLLNVDDMMRLSGFFGKMIRVSESLGFFRSVEDTAEPDF